MSEIGIEHSQTQCANNSDLELLLTHRLGEILAESSVDSLLTYKSISKCWNQFIGGQEFMRMHLKHVNQNMRYLTCRFAENSKGTEVIVTNNDGESTTILNFPEFFRGCFLRVVSSFNGLLILTADARDNKLIILICNPVTRKFRYITCESPSTVQPTVGIAFNLENCHYKIFRFFKHLFESEGDSYSCEVYAPETGSWRRIENVRYRPFPTPYSSSNDHVCVDGTAYWFGCPTEDRRSAPSPACIMSVNMNEEKFRSFNFPGSGQITQSSFLINLEGRLSLVTVEGPNLCIACGCGHGLPDFPAQAHLWVAEDLEQSTWLCRTSFKINVEGIDCFKSVVALKNEIFFIIADVNRVLHHHVYNTAKLSWRVLNPSQAVYNHSLPMWPVSFPYAESLCHCGGPFNCDDFTLYL